ncbi:YdiU family protein [Candidatus Pelagibacter sp.]|nr:YdiU family protein [Candidatus Pelagibacter sp.]
MNKINWNFNNTYFKLSNTFKEIINPVPVKNPDLVILNHNLASELNLDFSKLDDNELSKIFSGNKLPEGSNSIAQAYAGHQFGHFTMLGDGRAVLIGEHTSKSNKKYDIQFKGSGKTSFSRNGDGRAALGPMLREYIISEAMHFLNIPSTRSLAVVKTGEDVVREKILKGAILTRVASSHIRVGTFQYISMIENQKELKNFIDYTIDRHYPELKNSEDKVKDLVNALIDKQCDLVINWMRVGFIHGVMNTDNMTISGETIDYGPCAFMDTYDPKTVFSSIDKMGRYAYCNQPAITKWNLARFAECLLPFVHKDKKEAIKIASEIINSFDKKYETKWIKMMSNKIGLSNSFNEDKSLIIDLLTIMHKNKADYSNTFCHLMNLEPKKEQFFEDKDFIIWKNRWKERLKKNDISSDKSMKIMRNNNPLVIPRNHKIEEVLREAEQNNFNPFKKFLKILENPYFEQPDILEYRIPSTSNKKYQTFCGT